MPLVRGVTLRNQSVTRLAFVVCCPLCFCWLVSAPESRLPLPAACVRACAPALPLLRCNGSSRLPVRRLQHRRCWLQEREASAPRPPSPRAPAPPKPPPVRRPARMFLSRPQPPPPRTLRADIQAWDAERAAMGTTRPKGVPAPPLVKATTSKASASSEGLPLAAGAGGGGGGGLPPAVAPEVVVSAEGKAKSGGEGLPPAVTPSLAGNDHRASQLLHLLRRVRCSRKGPGPRPSLRALGKWHGGHEAGADRAWQRCGRLGARPTPRWRRATLSLRSPAAAEPVVEGTAGPLLSAA